MATQTMTTTTEITKEQLEEAIVRLFPRELVHFLTLLDIKEGLEMNGIDCVAGELEETLSRLEHKHILSVNTVKGKRLGQREIRFCWTGEEGLNTVLES